MSMVSLYADEDFFRPTVIELRRFGHDIITAPEAGMAHKGIPDRDQLRYATTHGRAILTRNVWDYRRFHLKGIAHRGIIACSTDYDFSAQARRIHDTIRLLSDLTQQWIRILRT